MIREGLQECEARIFIEKALTDSAKRAKLTDALANRVQQLLDDRWRSIRKAVCTLRAQGSWSHISPYLPKGWHRRNPVIGNDWFASTDWQSETEKLYEAAAQVEQLLKRD